jgi:hypothetical protein
VSVNISCDGTVRSVRERLATGRQGVAVAASSVRTTGVAVSSRASLRFDRSRRCCRKRRDGADHRWVRTRATPREPTLQFSAAASPSATDGRTCARRLAS